MRRRHIAQRLCRTTLNVIRIALFCFDYGLTFTREVERIWKRGLSAPAVLFYCVRYPALVSTIFIILDETAWAGISDEVCVALTISFRRFIEPLYPGPRC